MTYGHNVKGIPGVDVAIPVCNQERYVAQTIESVLSQQTRFPVRLVVAEDCSTDGTREIVAEYAARHPERVLPFFRAKNLGAAANGFLMLQSCTAKYLALLDGDDYWTDPLKLQKQVDFLEAHPAASMCFHNALSQHEEGGVDEFVLGPPVNKPFYMVEDLLLHGNFIPTASILLKRDCIDPAPNWFCAAPAVDRCISMACALRGPIGFLDETMSVYRLHSGGVYAGLSRLKQIEMEVQGSDYFWKVLPSRYRPHIRKALAAQLYRLALACARANQDSRARSVAVRALANSPWRMEVLPKTLCLVLHLVAPRLFGEVGVDRE